MADTPEDPTDRVVIGVLHVNADDPNVIVRDDGSVWVKPDSAPVATGQPLGEGWIEVGYTEDAP